MARYDFRTPRLYVDAPLAAGCEVALAAAQAHYLRNVLRLKAGEAVLVFNGRDGEWRATLGNAGKRGAKGDNKGASLVLGARERAQTPALDLD